MSHLADKANVNMAFAIQGANRFPEPRFECIYCKAVSKNRYYRDLVHLVKGAAYKGDGNVMAHKDDCDFYSEYMRLNLAAQKVEEKPIVRTAHPKPQPQAVQVAPKKPTGSIFDMLE